jgi:hypothetical protein
LVYLYTIPAVEGSGEVIASRYCRAVVHRGERIDELHREGLALKRQQFARAHPDADEAALDAMMRAWIDQRPLDVAPANESS